MIAEQNLMRIQQDWIRLSYLSVSVGLSIHFGNLSIEWDTWKTLEEIPEWLIIQISDKKEVDSFTVHAEQLDNKTKGIDLRMH